MDSSYILSIIGLTISVVVWLAITRSSFIEQMGSLGRMLKLVVAISIVASVVWLSSSFILMFLEAA